MLCQTRNFSRAVILNKLNLYNETDIPLPPEVYVYVTLNSLVTRGKVLNIFSYSPALIVLSPIFFTEANKIWNSLL